MADVVDVSDNASETILAADIQRARQQVHVKAAPRPDGLCCNDCDDPALVQDVMVQKSGAEANPDKLLEGEEIRLVDGVPRVFMPERQVTRFCSKECADDFEMRSKPPGSVSSLKNSLIH